MARVFFFITLIAIAFTLPFPFLIIAAGMYAFRYPAYELIVLGALIDALYGVGAFAYVYTFGAAGIFIFAELAKPFLAFYDTAA